MNANALDPFHARVSLALNRHSTGVSELTRHISLANNYVTMYYKIALLITIVPLKL